MGRRRAAVFSNDGLPPCRSGHLVNEDVSTWANIHDDTEIADLLEVGHAEGYEGAAGRQARGGIVGAGRRLGFAETVLLVIILRRGRGILRE